MSRSTASRLDPRRRGARKSTSSDGARLLRAALETLEQRRMLAADIVVNTDLDETAANSTTSLREAVALAVAAPGDDNIVFDEAFFTAGTQFTITLGTDGPLSIPNTGGKVTITGLGVDRVAVSGGGERRVFEIANGGALDVSGITISDGQTIDSPGGAISNLGTLSLTNVAVINNPALGSDGPDGDASTPAEDGRLADGGAIYTEGVLTITDSNIEGNSAIAGSGGSGLLGGGHGGIASGGAIYAAGGTLTFTNVTFQNNSASGGSGGSGPAGGLAGGDALGGVLFADVGTVLTINGGAFTFNFADAGGGAENLLPGATGGDGGDALGAGIYFVGTSASITNTDFSENDAGGGSAGAGGGNPIDQTSTDGHGGDAFGGAIFNDGVMTITGGEFSDNRAEGGQSEGGTAGLAFGGAIDNVDHLTVDGVTFQNNTATGGESPDGTGGNAAGGAIATQTQVLEVSASTFLSNVAQGGIGMHGGSATGGAINNSAVGTATIDTSTFSLNSAVAGENNAGDVDGNAGALARGGAVNVQTGTVTITNSTLESNSVFGGKGGDGAAGNGGTGGEASGGAVANAGTLNLTNTTIFGNTVSGGAGGEGALDGGSAGVSLGAGISSNGAALNALHVTVTQNQATSSVGGAGTGTPGADGIASGGGIYATTGASLTNTIVAANLAETSGADLVGTYVLNNSLIGSAAGGSYIVDAGSANNLLDVDADLGDLADNGGPTQTVLPNAGSPAIDAGSDTAAASLSFDQRGSGFPRLQGAHVDIGAVETEAVANDVPTIGVTGNGNTIVSGDTTPSTSDFTNFGSQFRYAQALQRTFVVTNTGTGTLTLSTPTVPAGYTIVEPLAASLGAGLSDSFTIRLSTANAGTFAGNVVIASNDAGTPSFSFKITGTISKTFKVNFQPGGASVPNGYVADAGLVFGNRGNGLSYGWNLSASSFTRDRNLLSDQAKDTLVHTQLYGARTWEVAVPNGTYQVRFVAGDAAYFDSVYKIAVEGALTVNGTPTSGNRFIEGTHTVSVSDGRLTVSNAAGSVNNKIAFIEITPL